MARKEGRGVAGAKAIVTGKKRLAGRAATSSGQDSAAQSQTRPYPLVERAGNLRGTPAADLPVGSAGVPEDTHELTSVEEVTGTGELTVVEEITKVVATPAAMSSSSRRVLPLPAPRDNSDDEEYTDVQAPKPLMRELPEVTRSEATVSARGRSLKLPKAGAPKSIESTTRTEVQDTFLEAKEDTKTITETITVADIDELKLVEAAPEEPAVQEELVVVVAEEPMVTASLPSRPKTKSLRWLAPLGLGLAALGLYLALASGPGKSDAGASEARSVAEAEAVEQVEAVEQAEAVEQVAAMEAVAPDAALPDEPEIALATNEASEPGMDVEPADAPIDAGQADASEKQDTSNPLLAAATMKKSAPSAAGSSKNSKANRRASPSAADKEAAQQHLKKGSSAFVAGKLPAAEREFQSALRLEPGAALALRGLGLVYERQGQDRKAIGLFRRYIKAAPRAGDVAKIKMRISALEGQQ